MRFAGQQRYRYKAGDKQHGENDRDYSRIRPPGSGAQFCTEAAQSFHQSTSFYGVSLPNRGTRRTADLARSWCEALPSLWGGDPGGNRQDQGGNTSHRRRRHRGTSE